MILINNSLTNFLDFTVKPMPHPTADKLVALFVRAASHQLPHQQIFEKRPKFEDFEIRNSRDTSRLLCMSLSLSFHVYGSFTGELVLNLTT